MNCPDMLNQIFQNIELALLYLRYGTYWRGLCTHIMIGRSLTLSSCF